MATRTRGKRGAEPTSSAAPQTRSATRRATRRTEPAAPTTSRPAAASSPAARGTRRKATAHTAASAVKPGSLAADPKPRRGAARGAREVSVATRPSPVDKSEDEGEPAHDSQLEEDGAYGDESGLETARKEIMAFLHPGPPQASHDQQPEEDGADGDESGIETVRKKIMALLANASHDPQPEEDGADGDESEDETVRKEIMALVLPDLDKASQELITHLKHPFYDRTVFSVLWKMKRDVFKGVLQKFQDPASVSPLIDGASIAAALDGAPGVSLHNTATILACANLASVLDSVEVIRSGSEYNPLRLLEGIDACFPTFFTTQEICARDMQVALDIRTSRLIELLAAQKKGANLGPHLATVFYEPAEGSDDGNGPEERRFRSLGGPEEATVDLLYERIPQIKAAQEQGKANIVTRLDQAFPLEDTLSGLREWILDTNEALLKKPGAQPTPEGEEYHDAEEGPDGSEDGSAAESQPIQRPAGERAEKSLFMGPASLKALERERGSPVVPPSNQQQGTPPRGTARDYPDDPNRSFLTRPVAPRPSQDAGAKRPRSSVADEDEDEDDEDPFQTDERPVDDNRRATIGHTARGTKRRRALVNQPPPPSSTSTAAPPSRAATQMPPPPRPAPSAAPPSSAPPPHSAFEAIRAASRQMAEEKRAREAQDAAAAAPHERQQRQAWSDGDCQHLLQLVSKYRASWAAIQRDDAGFEVRRNHQAYRDKARNMKVDFLVTGAVLPPGFDGVFLGPKEVAKVRSFGKNPGRRECDLVDGVPVNTELELGS